MSRRAPEAVLKAPPHAFLVLPRAWGVEFHVREDDFVLADYPESCLVEFRLPAWDDGHVLCVALVLRLADRNVSTFDHWLNPANPATLRMLQTLSGQAMLEIYLTSDRLQRSIRRPNTLAEPADRVVSMLRTRTSWTDDEYELRRKRLDTLYPKPEALWRAVRWIGRKNVLQAPPA